MKHRYVLTSFLILLTFSAFAQNGKCGENLTWTISDNTLTISGNGAMESYDSESNKAPWYAYRSSIASAVLSEGVTTIGSHAFLDCGSLTSIEIPASVTSIGEYALSLCLLFPVDGEFKGDTYDMPERRNGASENTCNNLQTITCYAVTPPSLEENAFFGVKKSVSVYVPSQSVDLYQAADQWKDFSVNAIALNQYTVTFMNGNKVIKEQIVEYGQGATAPVVEARVCQALTWDKDFSSVTEDLIVQAVWTEAPNATGYCGAEGNGSNLTWTLTCDSILTISGTGAMMDYDLEIESQRAPWYAYRNSIKSIVMEEGVNRIGNYAFANCHYLTTVEIPAGVSYIGDFAFSLCFSLEYEGEIDEGIEFDMPQRRSTPDDNACNTLRSIICYAVNPPALGSNVFLTMVQSSVTLNVPSQSVELYQSAEQWEDFFITTITPSHFTVTFMDGNTVIDEQTVEYGQGATGRDTPLPNPHLGQRFLLHYRRPHRLCRLDRSTQCNNRLLWRRGQRLQPHMDTHLR